MEKPATKPGRAKAPGRGFYQPNPKTPHLPPGMRRGVEKIACDSFQ
jgi:hypothetical protein